MEASDEGRRDICEMRWQGITPGNRLALEKGVITAMYFGWISEKKQDKSG